MWMLQLEPFPVEAVGRAVMKCAETETFLSWAKFKPYLDFEIQELSRDPSRPQLPERASDEPPATTKAWERFFFRVSQLVNTVSVEKGPRERRQRLADPSREAAERELATARARRAALGADHPLNAMAYQELEAELAGGTDAEG